MDEFKIDLDGDAVEDLTYRFTFNERDAHGKQRHAVRLYPRSSMLPTRTRPALSWLRGQPARQSPCQPGCAPGPVEPATRFGLRPICCTRLAMPFRTARPWICPDGIQAARRTSLPAIRSISIVLEMPDGELLAGAPNVMFSVAANAPVSLGIGKESVTSKPSKTFPYLRAAT